MPALLECPPSVTFWNTSWAFYLQMREEMSDATRVVYYKGKLEVMSPVSIGHESDKGLLARLFEIFCDRNDIPLDAAGALTLRSEKIEVALEPDESFYLKTTPPPHDAGVIDLSIHSPPDLAIEIEHSRSSIDKELIYRELAVPEIWRWDGTTLRIRTLRHDRSGYELSPTSRVVPALPVETLVEHMLLSRTMRQSEVARSWLKAIDAA